MSGSISSIVWETPEKTKRFVNTGTGKWKRLAQELRANPGKWALVYETKHHTTAPKTFRGKEYERAYRSSVSSKGGKVYKTYVRYVGDGLPE
jgi:hypothetical protein